MKGYGEQKHGDGKAVKKLGSEKGIVYKSGSKKTSGYSSNKSSQVKK